MNVEPMSSGEKKLEQGPYKHVDASHRMKLLPIDFVPTEDDVICGRGKKCYSHIGNDKFRDRVHAVLDLYRQSKNKLDKSKVLNMVVDQVRQNSPSGGFVKQDEMGRWYEVGDFLAREKTSQVFRDALHENYKSSSVAKKKRRQDDTVKATDRLKVPRSTVDIAQKIQSMSMEMKRAAKDSTSFSRQNDPQADVLAGIQFASRVMRQDMHPMSQGEFAPFGVNGVGRLSNANGLVSGRQFELEFEPDGQASYDRHPGSFAVPVRTRSLEYSSMPSGLNTGYEEDMFRQHYRPASVPPMFGSGADTYSGADNYSGDDNYSSEESMSEAVHHSLPNIEFESSDLLQPNERLHHSAPNLCYYNSPSEILRQREEQIQPALIPSTIEFQMQAVGGAMMPQQLQQPTQLMGQRQQDFNMMEVERSPDVAMISSWNRFAGMDLGDDNPFEPIPINDQNVLRRDRVPSSMGHHP